MNISKQTLRKKRQEKVYQQRINEFSFYIRFAATLFFSITTILLLDEKKKYLEHITIPLAAFAALTSVVFSHLLNTPRNMQNSSKSMKRKKMVYILILHSSLSAITLYLYIQLNDPTAIILGVVQLLFSLFLWCIPLINKFIFKRKL